MACPSLLMLTSQKSEIPFAADAVFTDLMLRDYFSEDVIRILGRGASAEEIPARQEIFRMLDADPSAAERFSAMAGCADTLARLLRRYDDPPCTAGAVMIFAHLAAEFLRFLDTAELPPCGGGLIDGFCTYIRSVRENPLTAELRESSQALPSFAGHTVRLRTVDASLQMNDAGEAWESRFEADLAAMGLPAVPPKQRSLRQMPAAFADGIAKLYPAEYAAAQALHDRFAPYLFGDFVDIRSLTSLSGEIGFYAAIHAFTAEMRQDGFPMTLPRMTSARRISLHGVRDISLRRRSLAGSDVVPNDLTLTAEGGDHFFWLTGANGGGKTVYLRGAGIALLLALNGCPAPCGGGEIAYFSRLMTHFPLNEDFSGTGRFDEEKQRADSIAEAASSETIVLLNETFSGTDEVKSAAASRALAETLHSRGAFGIYVTHLHELTGGDIPSLAAVIDETDGNRRTYRIVRCRRTDSSHAADILYKYALTREQLAERRERLGKR